VKRLLSGLDSLPWTLAESEASGLLAATGPCSRST